MNAGSHEVGKTFTDLLKNGAMPDINIGQGNDLKGMFRPWKQNNHYFNQ